MQSFLWRHPWRIPRLLAVLPCLLRFARGRSDHGELKASLLHAALGGLNRAALDRHTGRWVKEFLPRGCFDDALAAIRAHQSQQDVLVLMSASVDVYVPALARALGFQECICTATTWRPDGRYDGRLAGPNCRGDEKTRQFLTRSKSQPDLATWAYGNTRSDLPHLRLADRGFMINAGPRLKQDSEAAGVTSLDWR